jgi:hypothetical protein
MTVQFERISREEKAKENPYYWCFEHNNIFKSSFIFFDENILLEED